MSNKSYKRFWLAIGLIGTFGAGFATNVITNSQTEPEPKIEAIEIAKALYLEGKDETDDMLMAILALENAHPVVTRSYGYQYSWRADRFIIASRLLTDRQAAEFCPEMKPKLVRLRTALDKFADAFPDAIYTHDKPASAYFREIRMHLVEAERMTRIQVVGGDGANYNFGEEREKVSSSPPINIVKMRSWILRSTYLKSGWRDENDNTWQAQDMLARQALIDTLPELQKALREWPPEFSKKFEEFMHKWVKVWFEA